jgi:hypothetical protein
VRISATSRVISPPSERVLEKSRFINAYKRAIGRCQAPNCHHPEDVCAEGDESLFHMDHLHPIFCSCDACAKDPGLRKVKNISSYVYSGSLRDLKQELVPRKVRMLHGDCHKRHTQKQYLMESTMPRHSVEVVALATSVISIERFSTAGVKETIKTLAATAFHAKGRNLKRAVSQIDQQQPDVVSKGAPVTHTSLLPVSEIVGERRPALGAGLASPVSTTEEPPVKRQKTIVL